MTDSATGAPAPGRPAVGQPLAVVVVFATSAAVLVLEILAARLLAPYVGESLRTYTAIIGVVLAGIAAGSWLGGRWADAVDPRLVLGPVVTGGGLLGLAALPLTTAAGSALAGSGAIGTVLVTGLAFFGPALLLTAATPLCVALRLQDLAETGRVVGRLSAVGTAGALVGTFTTGFVLVAALPTRVIVVAVAGAMVVLGLGLTVALSRRGARRTVALAAVAVALGGVAWVVPTPCDVETEYYCAAVVAETTDDGRELDVLVLDSLRHSAVDVDDPSYLHFRYTQLFGAVLSTRPAGPLDVVHVGAGGLSMPRWLDAERPGSASTVLEIDPALADLARERLGWTDPPSTRVLAGDARLTLADLPAATADAVVGDAFGGLAVPWHLTTLEFLADVQRVLRPDGVYVLNVVDYDDLGLARAQTATLSAAFDHVAVVATPERLAGEGGGNLVLVATDASLAPDEIRAAVPAADVGAGSGSGSRETVLTGSGLERWVGDAVVLTDDYAPVDQLLSPADLPG
ncbi:fused MFS/spermidine synthase [Aquipuribacter nitratireducens]|uniref:Fused MFS/spermidine synthase n=1 Tax=Aquipuribacter nitratireducens TaxID=650104 RepID=A0ABW0GNP9_9MICO